MINPEAVDDRIIRTISPHEQMFRDEAHYWAAGRSALEWIDRSLQTADKPCHEVKRILDLPCGHGRVLRYLKAAFPWAEITACDLLKDGVDFCADAFGAQPVYSDEDPTKIHLARDAFDLVWVGSLLTHLDADLWPAFLTLFRSSLRPGGVLVFTTHGRNKYAQFTKRKILPSVIYKYERTGFGYADMPGTARYGISLSSAAWVFKQVERLDGMRLALFSERAWDKNQDVFACVRDAGWKVQRPRVSAFTFLRDHPRASPLIRVARRLLKNTSR